MCHSVQARAMGVYAAHCMSGVQDQASILTNSSSIVPWLSGPFVFFLRPPPLASCAFCLWHAAWCLRTTTSVPALKHARSASHARLTVPAVLRPAHWLLYFAVRTFCCSAAPTWRLSCSPMPLTSWATRCACVLRPSPLAAACSAQYCCRTASQHSVVRLCCEAAGRTGLG